MQAAIEIATRAFLIDFVHNRFGIFWERIGSTCRAWDLLVEHGTFLPGSDEKIAGNSLGETGSDSLNMTSNWGYLTLFVPTIHRGASVRAIRRVVSL